MATALVTGGTSGIGAEFARQLAARGHDLVLVARDAGRLAEVATELHARHGIRVETISADLADRGALDRVAQRVADRDRPIDILVNNAGFGVHKPLAVADTARHEYAFDVMCRAVLVLGGTAAEAMRERGGGAILNVSSVAGLLVMGSYSAIKAWVTAYSQGLGVELRGTGVRVTALLPGWVRTDFHNRAGIRASSIPAFLWIDLERVVRVGLRALDRGRPVSVPTTRFRLIGWVLRHLPRPAVRAISGAISSSRRKPAVGTPDPDAAAPAAEARG